MRSMPGGFLLGRCGELRLIGMVVVLALVISACGGSGAGKPSSVASGAAAPSAALLNVRILVTITDRCCSWYIPALAGARLGVWREGGLDVEWTPQVPGASPAMAAVLTGASDIAVINSVGAIAAAGAGRPARILSAEVMKIWQGLAIRPQLQQQFAKQGVTLDSPWQEKVKALKGHSMSTQSKGGPIETQFRALFTSLGIDPDKDVSMQGGTPDALNAAWRSGQIEAFECCEPTPFLLVPDAVVWLKPGEIKAPVKGYNTIFATTEQYARQNPEVLKRVIAVQKRMKQMILAATPGTKERDSILNALHEQYPTVPVDLIARSFDNARTTFDIDNDLSRSLLQDSIDDYNAGAAVKVSIKPEDLAAPGFLK